MVAITCTAALSNACFAGVSQLEVDAALEAAGANRSQIEQFLAHYGSGDEQKRDAARWLVANMPGHGFVEYALRNPSGEAIPFSFADYPSLEAAQLRLDELEKQHGPVDFKPEPLSSDLEHITAAFLIDNHDQAFATWRTTPWLREVAFADFLEFILPYRATNEPLAPGWRAAARSRISGNLAALGSSPTLAQVAQCAVDSGHAWCAFSDRYYMHPRDQNYDDMVATSTGRCEDITNMIQFAARAAGAMVASDFTPWWANRDNNHAWEVLVDARGNGTAPLSNTAAKVYRKCFGVQSGALGAVKDPADSVPGFLKSRTVRDVTAQYTPVSDVTVALRAPPGAFADKVPIKFVYLAVFNGGVWRPIAWALPEGGSATFHGMGRGILYMPVWADADDACAAGAPFILTAAGGVDEIEVNAAAASLGQSTSIEATTAVPATPDADTHRTKPRVVIAPDKEYELFVWASDGGDGGAPGWHSLGVRAPDSSAPLQFTGAHPRALYWLKASDGRDLERPFTLDGSAQVMH